MAGVIYSLCAATAILSCALLFRNYAQSRSRLVLWCGLCFLGLAINNVLLVVDRLVVPDIDLSTARLIPALLGMMLLIFGLIWERE